MAIERVPIGLVGATIEAPVARLRREAMAAQRAWLDDANDETRRAFGYALLDWAREAGDRRAEGHARALLAVGERGAGADGDR